MDRLGEIEALVAVIESGSFSAASERLGLAKSVISRRVSQLEKRLGSRLLSRTTRSLSVTDTGRSFYQRAVQILNDLEDAEQGVSAETAELHGTLKVAAPLSFGLAHLSGALTDFLEQHPAIRINLDLNDRNIDLVEEGFDLAVRIGDLQDSTLVARRLGTSRMVTCASHAYLERHGEPLHPDELQRHDGLQYTNIGYKQHWRYQDSDGKILQAQPQIRMRANNGEALACAAAAGMGITSGPTFILGSYLREGKLQLILTDYQRPSVGIYAVTPPGRLLPRRVQLFIAFLSERYGDHPYWDQELRLTE